MKKNKLIFWISTMSAIMYFSHNPQVTEGFKTLGYPPYMLYILGTAKLLGAIALLQPLWPRLREWAYAGATFTLLGAAISHIATATPFAAPLVMLAILAASWWANNQLVAAKA